MGGGGAQTKVCAKRTASALSASPSWWGQRARLMVPPPLFFGGGHVDLPLIYTMPMTDKERGQNIQFRILSSTIAEVDKGTALQCYYVKMCRTGASWIFTCSTRVYIIPSAGMFALSTTAIVEDRMSNCIFCPHYHCPSLFIVISYQFVVLTGHLYITLHVALTGHHTN